MHNLVRLTLILSALVPAAAHAQAPLSDARLAYFSPQRAFAQSATGRAAQARMTAAQAEKAREIETRNKALDAARAQRPNEVAKFEIDLQRFIQDAQAELTGMQQDLESAFLVKLRPALDRVAKEKGLLLVFNEDAGLLAWADPSLDITTEVIKRIDQP